MTIKNLQKKETALTKRIDFLEKEIAHLKKPMQISVEATTNLQLDDTDPEWNSFLIKYYKAQSNVIRYTKPVISLIQIFFLLYGLFLYQDNTSLPIISLFFKLAPILGLTIIFLLFTDWVISYTITYYSIRNEPEFKRILCKNLNLKWKELLNYIILAPILVVGMYKLIIDF